MKSRLGTKGFLLFELVVSIVIVTSGLLYVTYSYSSSKKSLERATELFKTSLLLEGKMWSFEQSGQIEASSQTGDFGEDAPYSWQMSAACLNEYPDINLISLSVFHKENPQETRYTIETYLKNKI